MRVVHVLRQLGGTARRQQLFDVGVSRREIDAAVASGEIKRPFRGCLTLPHVPQEQALARYFAAQITCVSAAHWRGIRTLERPKVAHLELHADRGGHHDASAPHALVRLHRSRSHAPDGIVAPAARAIDVASACVTPLAQMVMLDHALSLGKLALRDVDTFTITPRHIRAWLKATADPGSGSVSETCARVALRSAGLSLRTQAPFGNGRRADLLVEDCLYVEIDSYEFHTDRKRFVDDRARDRYLMGLGYRVMRFPYAEAVYYPERLVADVVRALAADVRVA